jgi:hypothetical protein
MRLPQPASRLRAAKGTWLLAACLLASCGTPASPPTQPTYVPPTTYKFTADVLYPEPTPLLPIEGAIVKSQPDGCYGVTDGAGHIQCGPMTAGTYTLTLHKYGFEDLTATLTIDGETHRNFAMMPVNGVTSDIFGWNLGGAFELAEVSSCPSPYAETRLPCKRWRHIVYKDTTVSLWLPSQYGDSFWFEVVREPAAAPSDRMFFYDVHYRHATSCNLRLPAPGIYWTQVLMPPKRRVCYYTFSVGERDPAYPPCH